MLWAGTSLYSQTTPPQFFFFFLCIGDTGQTRVADAPICSPKQNDLLLQTPPSCFHIEWPPAQRPLWTFKEAQRREQKETELRIKLGWIPQGSKDEGRPLGSDQGPPSSSGLPLRATCWFSSRWPRLGPLILDMMEWDWRVELCENEFLSSSVYPCMH